MDTWAKSTPAIHRLLEVYEEHGQIIVATDFDDTVYPYTFREETDGFESSHTQVLDLLRRCSKLGFPISVQTCSHEERWCFIKNYMVKAGIDIIGINCQPEGLKFGQPGKAYYNIILDDRAGLGQAMDILDSVLTRIERKQSKGEK